MKIFALFLYHSRWCEIFDKRFCEYLYLPVLYIFICYIYFYFSHFRIISYPEYEFFTCTSILVSIYNSIRPTEVQKFFKNDGTCSNNIIIRAMFLLLIIACYVHLCHRNFNCFNITMLSWVDFKHFIVRNKFSYLVHTRF